MNIDATESKTPSVLAYADGPAVVTEVEWRATPGGGIQLVVPTIGLWLRIFGTGWLVALLLPVVAAFLLSAIGLTLESLNSRSSALFGAIVADLMAAGLTTLWVRLLLRIVRLARHGKRPFSILISGGHFTITPVAWDAMSAGTWYSSDVINVRLDYQMKFLGAEAHLLITLSDGHELLTYVPWPGNGTADIEARLFDELVRDAEAHSESRLP